MVRDIEAIFPALGTTGYQVTSPPDRGYNCIAWATGETGHWWWPDPTGIEFWPPGVPRAETLAAFQQMLAALGFEVCAVSAPEAGFEKVALFADPHGAPRHAARQLASGRWTSKLGELADIEHELHALSGPEYGSVVLIMKRLLPATSPEKSGEPSR
jgi:hypothetical protein